MFAIPQETNCFTDPAYDELVFHVGPEGDFTSLTACLIALQDEPRPKTVYVAEGEYDIFREYREANVPRCAPDYTDIHNYMPYVVLVPSRTRIIGQGNVVLRYTPLAKDTYVPESKMVSPLNVSATAYVENMTVICRNGRYCLHDETLGMPEFSGAEKRYKNVRFIRSEENDPGLGFSSVLGAGFDDRMQFTFEDCVFENDIPNTATRKANAFYMHNRMRDKQGKIYTFENSSRVFVRNCLIRGKGRAVKFGNCSSFIQHIPAVFENCLIEGEILVSDEAKKTGLKPNSYDLRFIGCGPVKPLSAHTCEPFPAQVDQSERSRYQPVE